MSFKFYALALALVAIPSAAQTCTSKGDCQSGAIAGPYTSAQVAENTSTAPIPICSSLNCTSGSWSGLSIEGIDAQQNIGSKYAFYDKGAGTNFDDNIAVGPTVAGQNAQVVEWVNPQFIQAFDKETGQPIFTFPGGTTAVPISINGLWSASTQPECAQNSAGNVQVLYDRLDNEFVISRRVVYSLGSAHGYAWCIAASSGSDLSSPTVQWHAYEYNMTSVIPCLPSSNNCTTGSFYYYFPDWPRIGTWSDGFYITFDLQDPTKNYVEDGFEACKLDRADIAQGLSTSPMTCYTYMVPASQAPSLIHSVDVADIDSPTGPTSGEPQYFLSVVNPSNAQQGGNGQTVCTNTALPCTSNQLALFTWGTAGFSGPTFLAVNSYTPGCYNTSTTKAEANTYCVPEPSTSVKDLGAYGTPSCGNYSTPCLDSLGDRLANRLTYNNLSVPKKIKGEFLTASHVVMENSTNQRTGIRYYVIQVQAGKALVSENSGGSAGPPDLQDPNKSLWYFMPSAALDQNGNLGVTFTSSGPYCSTCQTQPHPALYFDVLPFKATSFDAPALIVQGQGDEENTDRYGEYAATVIDSTDNLTFYSVGEYFETSQTGTTNCTLSSSNCYTWQTRIFRGQYGNPF